MAEKNWIEKLMESEVNVICIDKDEYDCLIEAQLNLTTMVDLVFLHASLSYDKESIRFSTSALDDWIRVTFDRRYDKKLQALQEADHEKSDQSEE